MVSRLGSSLVLEVAVESPDPRANRRCAAALATRLQALPPTLVSGVIADVREERAFFADHRWLYGDLASLEAARDALRARLTRAKNPLSAADVEVESVPGKPGWYRAIARLRPHFQFEGLNASMRLVAELPKKK